MIREYELVSNKCGVIDLSWRGKIEVVFFIHLSVMLDFNINQYNHSLTSGCWIKNFLD